MKAQRRCSDALEDRLLDTAGRSRLGIQMIHGAALVVSF